MPDRAVLITGAARRIARALALHFADRGWHVGIHYNASVRDAEGLAEAIAVKGRKSGLYQADLSDPSTAASIVARFVGDFPAAAMLINSASIYEHDTIANLDPDLWQRQMRINALAPILLAKAFHERVVAAGSIINMLDTKVTQVTPDYFSYTLSKLALFNATRMLAMAFGPKSRVNGIAPGLTLRSGGQTEEEFERTHNKTPLGVGPTAADVCRAASLIADTPSMTGQVITIDGGRHLEMNDPVADLPKE